MLKFAYSTSKTPICAEYRHAAGREDGRASWPGRPPFRFFAVSAPFP